MSRKKAQVGLRARTVDHLNAWLIMLPSLVLMLFFVWEPLFESVVMSLYKTAQHRTGELHRLQKLHQRHEQR